MATEEEKTFVDKKDAKKQMRDEIRYKKALAKRREKIHLQMIRDDYVNRKKEKIVPTDYCISLQHINKIYPNHVQAVYDFNLDIKEKEFIVLVGPSGCGKSTTLRMIAGLEDITYGDFYIAKKYGNDLLPKERDIAMVFQNYALYPSMTVYDNMAFSLKVRHMKKEEINKRVQEAATILGIKEYLYRKPSALSGGQRQRVALGRAIVRNAKVFLMDEPLSNLDAKLRVQMRSEIIKLHRRVGSTTLYVTHDQTEAMTMASRIVVMKDGYIQQIGTPKEIYNYPSNIFVATFIGAPAMNIVEAQYDDGTVILPNGFSFQLKQNQIKQHNDFYLKAKEELEKKNSENSKLIEEKRKEYSDLVITNMKNHVEKTKEKYQSKILAEEATIRYLRGELAEDSSKEEKINKQIEQCKKRIKNLNDKMTLEVAAKEKQVSATILKRKEDEQKLFDKMSEKEKEAYQQEKENKINDYMAKDDLVLLSNKEIDDNNETIKLIDEIIKTKKHKVIFGVRPEDLVLDENKALFKNKSGLFEAEVSLTELLGNEYYVHSLLGETDVISKCGADINIESGNKIKLCLNFDHIHLFDSISQNSII